MPAPEHETKLLRARAFRELRGREPMRIVEIRERPVSLRSAIRNAWIDFSEMTTSVVVVVSDVKRNGKPVVGLGFNSNGRYAQSGILRERLIPRLLAANPSELLDATGRNLDPHRVWDTMMKNEKPGGHGERPVAVAAVDMAIFDLIAKIDEKPLYQLLADQYGGAPPDRDVFVYAAGGYYYPGKDTQQLQREMQSYLEAGYTVVKMKIGGASLDEDLRRIEAVLEIVGDGSRLAVDANGRLDGEQALAYAEAVEPYGLVGSRRSVIPLITTSMPQSARTTRIL